MVDCRHDALYALRLLLHTSTYHGRAFLFLVGKAQPSIKKTQAKKFVREIEILNILVRVFIELRLFQTQLRLENSVYARERGREQSGVAEQRNRLVASNS
jgi:hypothetical protein